MFVANPRESELRISPGTCLRFYRGDVILRDGPTGLLWPWTPASRAPEDLPLGTLNGSPVWARNEPTLEPGAHRVSLRALAMQLDEAHYAAASLAAQLLHFEQSYRHCPRCALALVRVPTGRQRHCEACSDDWYPRIAPCAIVLVSDGDRLLMTRQAKYPVGMFGIVAGFVEAGESLEECARREVFEETRISVKNLRYVGSQHWPFPQQLMAGFFAEYDHGELKVDHEELEDAQWFTLQQLPPLPPKPSIARRMIEDYVTQRA
ncbi:MAG: NAD(+) diphosphatase [Deltaproteobacteria bacterium]|nr:NAD(+) diphosphatase [Deltaproteobacteria bacterium]